jgi:hypothetical protein
MNKKASELPTEQLVFLLLNLVFFSILFLYLYKAGGNDSVVEEVYSKKIALVLDQMEKNMEVEIDASRLLERVEENKFKGVILGVENNVLQVRVREKGGYSFNYFSDVEPEFSIDMENKKIIIKT